MNTITRLAALAGLTMATGASEGTGPIIQQAYVKASNSGMNDRFGASGGGVALAGDTLVAGAPGEDSSAKGVDGDQGDGLDPSPRNPHDGFDSGAAYVFWRYGSGWAQQAYLKSTDTAEGDGFGQVVAVSGDTVVVSAPGADGQQAGVPYRGAVYVFAREGTTWRQQACLKVPGLSGMGSFGGPVAICGDTVVVGVDGESSAPAAAGGQSGDEGELMAGAVHVFVRHGGEWSRQARLEASNARYKLHFGTSVAISGDTLIVGAIGDNSAAGGVNGDETDDSVVAAGAAYVFVRDGTKWSQQAYLKAPKPREFDRFGTSVAISGDTAVVGAVDAGAGSTKPGAKGNDRSDQDDGPGAAFVFVRDGDTWSGQASLMPPKFQGGEEFGCSVAICGDRLVVGAQMAGDLKDPSRNLAGAAYVFTRKAAIWDPGTQIMASNAERGDQFGGSVAISGGTVAVGAVGEDGVERGVNGNQGDDYSGNTASGAAYVFAIPGADSGGMAPAGAGEGKGTLEERIFGYWASDWDAMAKSWQPLAEQLAGLNLSARHGDEKDRAAAVQAVVEDMKSGFDVQTMEIKKGEMLDYIYPGKPDRKTYRVKSLDEATGTLELEVASPGEKPLTIRVVLSGDRFTLTEGEGPEHLPLVFNRIDAAAFEARRKAAELKYSKKNSKPSLKK